MTPSDIEILIHCHVCPAPHPRAEFPAVRETIEAFVRSGLIEKIPAKASDAAGRLCAATYQTTSRGAAHITQLCDTHIPTQVWVGASGQIIRPN